MDNTCDRCKKEKLGYVDSVFVGTDTRSKVFCKSCYSIIKESGELEKIRKELDQQDN